MIPEDDDDERDWPPWTDERRVRIGLLIGAVLVVVALAALLLL